MKRPRPLVSIVAAIWALESVSCQENEHTRTTAGRTSHNSAPLSPSQTREQTTALHNETVDLREIRRRKRKRNVDVGDRADRNSSMQQALEAAVTNEAVKDNFNEGMDSESPVTEESKGEREAELLDSMETDVDPDRKEDLRIFSPIPSSEQEHNGGGSAQDANTINQEVQIFNFSLEDKVADANYSKSAENHETTRSMDDAEESFFVPAGSEESTPIDKQTEGIPSAENAYPQSKEVNSASRSTTVPKIDRTRLLNRVEEDVIDLDDDSCTDESTSVPELMTHETNDSGEASSTDDYSTSDAAFTAVETAESTVEAQEILQDTEDYQKDSSYDLNTLDEDQQHDDSRQNFPRDEVISELETNEILSQVVDQPGSTYVLPRERLWGAIRPHSRYNLKGISLLCESMARIDTTENGISLHFVPPESTGAPDDDDESEDMLKTEDPVISEPSIVSEERGNDTEIDDLSKLFEGVDPPDELDIGADGSSMQEVLVGETMQIVMSRVNRVREAVASAVGSSISEATFHATRIRDFVKGKMNQLQAVSQSFADESGPISSPVDTLMIILEWSKHRFLDGFKFLRQGLETLFDNSGESLYSGDIELSEMRQRMSF